VFIDIDYNKRKQEAKLHLAKPNKRVIDIIDEKFNDKMSIKLGNVNQLDFSIPYQIEQDGEMVLNPHVDTIREKMLIRVTLGAYKEWYIVDSIEEDAEDSDTFNVTAFSLPYELKGKRVSQYTEDTINATNLLTNLLEPTVWKIGTVDPMFDVMFRSFDSGDDSNVLDCIVNAGETYGALIVWNTVSKTVSFKDATKNGQFRGMIVNYGRFLNSIKRTRTTDEMVTRLYVYGGDDLNITAVNPTGMPYLENFGYFMFPFQRDENRNVLASSNFMSDELCHALLDHEVLVEQNGDTITALTNDISTKTTQLSTEQATLTELQGELTTAQGLLDTASSTDDQTLIAQRRNERDTKQSEVTAQTTVVEQLKTDIGQQQYQLQNLQNQISMESILTQELIDELNLYIIESAWKDDRYIDATELYNDALVKFDTIRQPKVVIDVTIDNLLNIIDEQYYWDKITLGDLIKIKYPQMNIEYMAKIIQIDYDFGNQEISLTIANTTDLLSETDKLVQLLYNSSNATSTIQNNKYKWDKVGYVQDQVSQLVQGQWDATKNEIIAGVNNSVTVGNRGIIISNPDIPDDIVIMQAGVIALSKDGGETWHTAIKPDGIVAERIIGRIIAGEELIITNSYGTFTFDNTGVHIEASAFVVSSSSGDNLVQQWSDATSFINDYVDDSLVTPFEKSDLKNKWDGIVEKYNANQETVIHYWDDTTGLTFVSDYSTNYTTLYNYLFVDLQVDGKAILANDNMSEVSSVVATTFKAKFNNFYSAQTELEKQLSLRAKTLADQAQSDANDAQNRINEVADDVVYKTELFSTNGDKFNNGNIDTTLYIVVYKGATDITDTLPNSSFVWRKSDKDGVQDTVWNNAHNGVGKSIHVTKDDVSKKATFWCDIDIV
jgi:phage minor structural protein